MISVNRLPYAAQMRLATVSPIASGVASGTTIGLAFADAGWPTAVGALFAWGIGIFLGGKSLRYIRRLRRVGFDWPDGPSWGCAAYGGILAVFAWIALSGLRLTPQLVANIGIATNTAYLGAKLRCYVLRCCEAQRGETVLDRLRITPRGLQSAELITSVLILSIAVIMLRIGEARLSGWIALSGHGAVRSISGYLRFPNRSFVSLLLDPGAGGLIALACGLALT